MPISVTCPTCDQRYEVKKELLGKKLRCQKCDTRIVFLESPNSVKSSEEHSNGVSSHQKLEKQSPELDEEEVLFVLTPSARAYIGQMLKAAFWSIIFLISIIIADSFIEPYEIFGFCFLPPLLIGGWTALSIWIDVISTQYKLTTQRYFHRKGLIAKHIEEIELFRVKDVSYSQDPVQRILGFGSVTIYSTDDSTPITVVKGIANPAEVKELIRTTFRAARKREGVKTSEWIPS